MRDLIYRQELLSRIPIGITDGQITLTEDESGKCDEIIRQHHYSHKTTKNRFLSLQVDGIGGGYGAIQLGYGIRPKMKHTISTDIQDGNFCEFDRMWLSDDLPKFSESRAIGLLLSYIKQVHKRIKFIITYADESAGNRGTIYKATNAFQLESVQCDFYLLPSGERIHPVSMYHRHKTRAKAFVEKQYPGIKHIKGEFRQFRFLYILDNKLRRKFQCRNADAPRPRDGLNSRTPLQISESKIA